MKTTWLVVLAFVVAGCGASADDHAPQIEFLNMPGANPDLPFSDAVRVDKLLFLSGVIGNKPGTLELVDGGIQAETRQIMETIKGRVEAFGSSMDKVVKCSVFMADMSEWGAMNEVYRSYFDRPPARSALGASGLALGAAVEIECIAVVG
ncbi:MAG: Rid family hydrolase [Woeseiaceae bacterium]|nr:Rid family hydrolase [Woeseiaceae bacterium]